MTFSCFGNFHRGLLHHVQVQQPAEYKAFWKRMQAGVTYLFVQLHEVLFLATRKVASVTSLRSS